MRAKEEFLNNLIYLSESIGKRDFFATSDIASIENIIYYNIINDCCYCVPCDDNIKILCKPTYNPVVIKYGRFVMDVHDTAFSRRINIWIVNDETEESLHIVSIGFKHSAIMGLLDGFWIRGKWDNVLAEAFYELYKVVLVHMEDKKISDERQKQEEEAKMNEMKLKFEELF